MTPSSCSRWPGAYPRWLLVLVPCLIPACAALAQTPEPYAWQKAPTPMDANKQRLGGLDFQVELDAASKWPRLTRQMPLCTGRHADNAIHEPDESRPYGPITLGLIRVPGASQPQAKGAGRTWCGSMLGVGYTPVQAGAAGESSQLTLSASRLHPGVVISAPDGVTLFAGPGQAGKQPPGDALPAYFAVGSDGDVAIRPAAAVGELPLAKLGEGWMLVWYGQQSFFSGYKASQGDKSDPYRPPSLAKVLYKADCPMLVLFSVAPSALQASKGEGLTIRFGQPTGRVLVLPLMGEVMPKAEQTEKWKDGLPADVVDRCRWWAAHAKALPTAVAEEYSYDAASDTVTLFEQFTFEPFRAAGSTAAPIPPMMAMASIEGFPIEFSTRPQPVGLETAVGPLLMVENASCYQMRVKGLGKYVAGRPAPAAGQAPEALTAQLSQEVRKALEAGHMAPWFRVRKICDGWKGNFFPQTSHMVHGSPGETLYFLADVLPLLPANLQEQVKAYLKRERTQYPPEKINILPGHQGARREGFAFSPAFLKEKPAGPEDFDNVNFSYDKNFYVSHKLIPPMAIYGLAAYYQAVGTDGLADAWPAVLAARAPYLRQMDWATGTTHQWPNIFTPTEYQGIKAFMGIDTWYGNGGVVDANNAFAAAIGQIRLARLAKDPLAENVGWGTLARTAALRFALGKIPGYYYRHGLLEPAPGQTSAEADLRQAFFVDEFGISLRIWTYDDNGLSMLFDAVPEVGMFVKDFLAAEAKRYYDRYEQGLPAWYLAWNEQCLDGESNRPMPQDTYQTFMAHAWVLGSSPQWLEKHLDLPWVARGDLYYMHKLAETIRAYKSGAK